MKTNSCYYAPLLLLALSAMISACGARSAATEIPAQATIPVKLLPLDAHTHQDAIHESGAFTTDDEVLLSFKTGGIIQRILVREGDSIRQGQTVATLNPVEVDAQVQQAHACALYLSELNYRIRFLAHITHHTNPPTR